MRKGKEKGDHKKDHPFTIIDKLDMPLFEPDWTAMEDLALLKGISQSGIDNWIEISEKLNLKTAADCEAHFYSFYYKSEKDPIPNRADVGCDGRDKNNKPIIIEKILQEGLKRKEKFMEEKLASGEQEHKEAKAGYEDDNISDTSRRQKAENPISDVRSLVGYMPKRGDFDTEYDEEAETRICEMEFNDDDTEEEIQLKFKVLEYYNARLDERIRRKKFVIDRGLLDLKKIQKQEKKRSKEERDIIN